MPNDDARAIAARLTWGEQRALLWLPSDGSKRSWTRGTAKQPNSGALYALQGRGLASRSANSAVRVWAATEDGLRVRAALAEMEGKNDGSA